MIRVFFLGALEGNYQRTVGGNQEVLLYFLDERRKVIGNDAAHHQSFEIVPRQFRNECGISIYDSMAPPLKFPA